MKNKNGFTLIELLVAMAIAMVVMTAIYYSYISQQKAYVVTEDVSEVQQNLRAAIYYMERDLRMVGLDPLENFGFGFTSMTANSVTMTMDLDANGILSGSTETVAYLFNAGTNTLTKDGQTIAQNISGVTFTYRDRNNAVTADPANVRAVDIVIDAGLAGHDRTLTTRVRCRNMGI